MGRLAKLYHRRKRLQERFPYRRLLRTKVLHFRKVHQTLRTNLEPQPARNKRTLSCKNSYKNWKLKRRGKSIQFLSWSLQNDTRSINLPSHLMSSILRLCPAGKPSITPSTANPLAANGQMFIGMEGYATALSNGEISGFACARIEA